LKQPGYSLLISCLGTVGLGVLPTLRTKIKVVLWEHRHNSCWCNAR